jgi:hypothetical protein
MGLNGTGVRAVLVQRLMGARTVVVPEIGAEEPAQLPLIEDEDVVRRRVYPILPLRKHGVESSSDRRRSTPKMS